MTIYYCLLSVTELSLCGAEFWWGKTNPLGGKGKNRGMTKPKRKLIINFVPKVGEAPVQKGGSHYKISLPSLQAGNTLPIFFITYSKEGDHL